MFLVMLRPLLGELEPATAVLGIIAEGEARSMSAIMGSGDPREAGGDRLDEG